MDLPSVARLHEVLDYDPNDGSFRWRITMAGHRQAGRIAGGKGSKGYHIIGVDNLRLNGANVAWAMMTGAWPEHLIDHIDLCRTNNAWDNLRPATFAQNIANRSAQSNNALGLKGVCKRGNRYRAVIKPNGRQKHLGFFATAEEAHAAYQAAATEIFGEFARAA